MQILLAASAILGMQKALSTIRRALSLDAMAGVREYNLPLLRWCAPFRKHDSRFLDCEKGSRIFLVSVEFVNRCRGKYQRIVFFRPRGGNRCVTAHMLA